MAAAAHELSLYESQLYAWRSKQHQQLTSSERESELAAENARLKRQLAEQAEELAILKNGRDILREAPEAEYVFIEKHRAEFSVKAMCRVLRVARSGWSIWCLCHHQIIPHQRFRLICDIAVRKAFTEAKQRYGAPHLADELPEYNIKTIAVRGDGRKFSPVISREHGLPVSENLLKQDFYASGPNQKWAGDITDFLLPFLNICHDRYIIYL